MAMKLQLAGLEPFVKADEMEKTAPMLRICDDWLNEKTGAGKEYLGWVDLPTSYNKAEFARIKRAAEDIQKKCEVFIVIGIGGSYLGARAAVEFVKGQKHNGKKGTGIPEIYFLGNSVDANDINDVLEIIGDRHFCINVISKSGKTTEPAIAFRVFKKLAEQRYGKDGARSRIYATTDENEGALKDLARQEEYESFVVPDDVGGRYSVLTAVGLLPMAVAGLDISQAMQGAADAMQAYSGSAFAENDCMKYAALRNILLRKGKYIEVLVNYMPKLTMFGEWFKQLYAESEGKEHKGIFPVSANFTTDLHSIGQFIQDGARNLFETVIWVKDPQSKCVIEHDPEDVDGLNYLVGKDMQFVNEKAFQGTLLAHMDGGTPNIVIEIDRADEYHFGWLAYFFEKACGLSGYLLGVNPFDQPGVEDYKKNMFALLGKEGYEARKEALEARLSKG